MRTTIFGGHGKVALLLAPLLVEAGHEVRSVIRNPDHVADVEATGATAVVSSVEDADLADLTDLLRGSDAVVWSAGAGGGDPKRTDAVDRDAAIRSMDAAVAAGVARYVMVSFSGASTDHLVAEDDPFRRYQDAKIAADEHLRGTDLGWTILGPGALTTEPSDGKVNPAATSRDGDESPRELVAQVAAAVLADERAARRTLVFGKGDVPIADWLGSLG
ncbi:NAD-dependent dehydratase [Nocardioides flavus (ex Wang et al. 2016)]|uniref:NAD-dependent dehydratase n=1 Tax=Nocardioides flavus (ex Wang et al. 2016) TaxID=2058780 RepID=A0ABQ3HQZ4_9ACTN|nr:NAD(P)H-binding protein [Nocardioides flavus (ex Wang et al. 2016)]GHE19059.1 NAD-dependent dehydratase [Nocardioides flavus (ex Wang et al. 2016)]